MPEFSRPLRADRIAAVDETVRIAATPAERAGLAQRYRIEAVDHLEAEVTLRPEPGGTVRARGSLDAAVVQACVVSFEPVAQQIAEPVDLRFIPAGSEPGDADDPDAPDELEMSESGVFDLGEAIAEQVALALDPYPRAEGAELPEDLRSGATADEARPFGALARLRRDEGGS